MNKYYCMFCLLIFVASKAHADAGFSIGVNFQIVFGTHNQYARASLVAFGAANDNNLAIESGGGIWVQGSLRRFNAKTMHWSAGYDAFVMAGFGDNGNQLGSALLETSTPIFFEDDADKGFVGLGFGVTNEHFTGSLNKFSQRRGRALLRFANRHSSLHLTFANDLRDKLFLGEASDYGQTASATIKFNQIREDRLFQLGVGLDLFTPQPDFSRAPDNEKNSADGRKRVWYTSAPWEALYNANFYIEVAGQDETEAWSLAVGLDNPKLGALAQNVIHDEFGLTPRFAWPIEESASLFFEANVSYQFDD